MSDEHKCPNCGAFPIERPGLLETRLAEAQAALACFTPHGMEDVRTVWANGRVCEDCSHGLCVSYRGARERLTEARGALSAIAYVAQDVETCKRWAVAALAALNAGKEAPPP